MLKELDRVKAPKAENVDITFSSKESVAIKPPNFQQTTIRIVGTAPFCMNRMSSENRDKMVEKQKSGQRAKKGQMRPPKDFEKIYQGTMHVSTEGWYGIPAAAFRNAMVSACKIVGFAMTRAKLSLFVIHDGLDREDGQPLVKIIQGKPVRRDFPVKLADGSTDILPRAFFDEWVANVKVQWDGDQFSAEDVFNLMSRVGIQVGVGAGRPDSKNSTGMGWGTFRLENHE